MKKRITVFTIILSILMSLISMPAVVHAEFRKISEDEYAEMKQTFKTLDLTAAANRGFADDAAGDGKGGWTDQGAQNDLSSFDLKGKNTLKGVEFDIIDPEKNGGKSCVVLRGQNDMSVPTSAEMEVNDKIAGVYFLHASAYVAKTVGRYVFVYEDGSKETVIIRGSKDVFNWWGNGQGEYTVTAWSGSNQQTSMVSLYMFCCSNPQPSKKVSKIIAETDGNGSYLMLVAATTTDAGPYMPVAPDTNPDMTNWYAYEQPKYDEMTGTALDASYLLDAPSGKHGYIHTSGEKMYFEDGTEAHFWSVNIGGDGIFDISKEGLEKVAERVAALGFNCVRFHHMDAYFLAPTNIFGGHRKDLRLDPWRMDKLCYLMSELKKRGVYWLVDQTVSRQVTEEDNFEPGYTELGMKKIAYFDSQAQQNRFKYSENLLTWKNPYTGMTIGEDPSLVMIDLENENSPFQLFEAAEQYDYYTRELRALLVDWLRKEYGTDEALINAWSDKTGDKPALLEGESIEKGNIEIVRYDSWGGRYTNARRDDLIRFSYDLVIDYANRYTEHLRSLGVRALIVPMTNFGMNATANAYAHAVAGDFSDIHAYWTHTSMCQFMKGNILSSNGPISSMNNNNLGFMGVVANSRVYGMPYTLSEWNICAINPTASECNMLMASYASMQNWNPFYFAWNTTKFEIDFEYPYEVRKLESGIVYNDKNFMISEFAMDGNPVKMATMPAASMLFHRRDVKEAEKGYYNRYGDNDYFISTTYQFPTDAGYAMVGKTGAMLDVKAYDADKLDNDVLYLSKKARKDGTPYVSVTGEMSTDIKNQIFKVNTERSQAAVGYLAGTVQELDDVKFEVDNKFSSCTLTSLSKDEPIYSCDRLLLTVAGDQRNSGEVRSNDQKKILQTGHAPILVEQITGKVTLKSKDDFDVYTLSSGGKRKDKALTRKDKDGNTVIYMQLDDNCLNYEIVRTKKNGESKPNEKVVFSDNKVEPVFTDVGFDHWANKEITRLALLEKIDLDWGGEFKPEENVTKGAALKWIAKASDLTTKAVKDNFANIDENDPDAKALGLAKTYELAQGDENDNINKDDTITRAEVMAAMEKVIKVTGQNKSGITGMEKTSYSDWSSVGDDMKPAVEFMLAQSYVKDLWQGEIEPEKPVTRAELAHILFGMLWY